MCAGHEGLRKKDLEENGCKYVIIWKMMGQELGKGLRFLKMKLSKVTDKF